MASVYNLEPPTKGKVVMKTTMGDVDVELWPKEAPKAVRNFVQLCLEGYYDGTPFHRIIKGFLIQGGDPTGDGTGGESIYGGPFRDEFHSRLKFAHRGLLACANENMPHTNGSQFFITLDATPGLDKKNTIFGKVTGETIYNVVHMGELDTDDQDRPANPPILQEVDILWNPFEDIVPRTTREEQEAAKEAKRAAEEEAVRQEKRKRKKNPALLSFGEPEGDEEAAGKDAGAAVARAKMRSAHDVTNDPRLIRDDTEEAVAAAAREAAADEERRRLRTAVRGALQRNGDVRLALASLSCTATPSPLMQREAPAAPAPNGAAFGGEAAAGICAATADDEDAGDDDAAFGERMRGQAQAKRARMGDAAQNPEAIVAGPGTVGGANNDEDEDDEDNERESRVDARREDALGRGRAQPALLRQKAAVPDAELLTEWQARRAAARARNKQNAARDADALARIASFTARLRASAGAGASNAASAGPTPATGVGTAATGTADTGVAGASMAGAGSWEAAEAQGYAGRVRGELDHDALKPAAWRVDAYLEGNEDVSLATLRAHRLTFRAGVKDAMARSDDVDDLMVVDPRLEKARNSKAGKIVKGRKEDLEWNRDRQRPPRQP